MVYFVKAFTLANDEDIKSKEEFIINVNRLNYDYLYIKGEAYSEINKNKFLWNVETAASLSEIPVIVEMPVTEYSDADKLYYSNIKMLVASNGSTLDKEKVEEAKKAFGEDFFVDYLQFGEKVVSVNSLKNTDKDLFKSDSDLYVLDNSDELDEIASLKYELKEAGIDTKALNCLIKWADLKKNSDNMVPVVVMDYKTKDLLMLAYMNEEAYNNTFKTGLMTYYSRSRNELWVKGLTSGHFQFVKSIKADCDLDTLVAYVSQIGAPCHTGRETCFFNDVLVNN